MTATPTLDPSVCRTTWRTLEPYHAMVYFAPEPQEEYTLLGFDPKANRAEGYFPARAAAMGAVTAGVVQATFFNFSRLAVDFGMAGAWDKATPAQLIEARYRGADRALRRLLGDLADKPEVVEALGLARTATEGCTPYGRPLFAANADLPWPEEPHLALWHAITLLREFRGDGHIAVLVDEGISGIEAAVTHVAQGDLWTREALRTTRAYSEEEWQATVDDLRARGWLDADEKLTGEDRTVRARVEARTDALALPAWERLGDAGAARLRELGTPLVRAIIDNGGFPLGR